jgi:phosphoribosylformylglycinamidine (FGAM) synthase-like enzyme
MGKKLAIPKKLGACADKLYQMRAERLLMQKAVDEMRKNEKVLTEHLILNLSKEDAEGVKGKLAKVGITRSVVGHATDWQKFYAYVKKNNAFDLMQKRLNDKALKERWEDKKTVPGVEPFHVLKVSLTKV